MRKTTNKYYFKNIALWSLGVALVSAPLAVAASCGSSDEKVASATSIDTSQVARPSISLSGTTTAPVVNINGFSAPANTVLKFKVGTSAWLSQADFVTYIIANAATLTTIELAAAKAHLEPVSTAYTLTDARETTLAVTLTNPLPTNPVSTLINTASANLAVISLSGITTAPVINLNGFSTPANTVLRFSVSTSGWLDEAAFNAYIKANAAALTTAQLIASKAHLEPVSTAYTLTSARETALLVSIVKISASNVIDTSAVDLAVITLDGYNLAPLIDFKGVVAPSYTIIKFQIGSSLWMNQTDFISFIKSNSSTITPTESLAARARLEALSPAYTLSDSRETKIGSIMKFNVDTNSMDLRVITLGGSSAAPVVYINNLVIPPNAKLGFKMGSSPWQSQADFIASIIAQAGKITTADLYLYFVRVEPINDTYSVTSNHQTRLIVTMAI